MNKLGDLYTEFFHIDLDTPGGYARVAQVKTNEQKGYPDFCAFKIMRHENDYARVMERFEYELKLLVEMTNGVIAPSAITRIYDSGFVPTELSQSLHKRETPKQDTEIISIGKDVSEFIRQRSELQKKRENYWLPYLVVELAPYDDSILRQIRNQPQDDPAGLFRFPTGEVLMMAIQLLDVMNYLHTNHNLAYMDWKPEHVFWNGKDKKVKLIDWNVTSDLDDGPGKQRNIRDDLRLFCGAVLYIGLTFVDPDDPKKLIGPRPTKDITSPVPEIRRRYWTDSPNFYQRGITLDEKIKAIIRTGLDPEKGFDSIQELKTALLKYGKEELGLTEFDLASNSESYSPYFKALTEVHMAQRQLFQAQQHLIDAVKIRGTKLEFTRLFDAIKLALKNFPVS